MEEEEEEEAAAEEEEAEDAGRRTGLDDMLSSRVGERISERDGQRGGGGLDFTVDQLKGQATRFSNSKFWSICCCCCCVSSVVCAVVSAGRVVGGVEWSGCGRERERERSRVRQRGGKLGERAKRPTRTRKREADRKTTGIEREQLHLPL